MLTPHHLGFFNVTVRSEVCRQQGEPIEPLTHQVVFREVFRPVLENVLRRSKRKKRGRSLFDVASMFKVLVL